MILRECAHAPSAQHRATADIKITTVGIKIDFFMASVKSFCKVYHFYRDVSMWGLIAVRYAIIAVYNIAISGKKVYYSIVSTRLYVIIINIGDKSV